MPRKRTLAVIFIALVLIGFSARGPITSTFFEWYLKGYCRTCLGSRLTYENLRHENDQWVFDHPVLTTKKRLEEGGYRFQADHAALKVGISWWDRSLSLNVNLENPQLDIGKGAEDMRHLLEQPVQTFHMFAVHTKFDVAQGTIFVHNFDDDDLVPIPLFFHVQLACKDTKEGCTALWFGEERKNGEGFLATFSENGSSLQQIHLEMAGVNCCSLQQILKGIWPEYKAFSVSNGMISGSILLTLPVDSPGYAEGHATLKDLAVKHTEMDLEVDISQIALNLAPKEVEKADLKKYETVGNVEVHPANITLKRNGEEFWKIEDAAGSASFNKDDYANLSFSGLVQNNGKKCKLAANGNGRFSQTGQSGYSCEMHLKRDEPNSDTDFYFSARELGDHWSFGEVELLGFGVEELNLVQHLLAKNYSQWQNVDLHQGTIDAAMLVYLKGFKLSEVNVERIVAHRAAISFEPWDLNAGVEKAFGSLSFDLSNDDPLKTLNVDLKIKKGNLSLEGLEKASWELAGINTNLSIRQGIFQNSVLEGTVAGLKGELALDGTTDGPMMSFNFHGNFKGFAKALPEPVRKGLDKKFINDDLKIIANAKKDGEGLLFDGRLLIEPDNAPVEEIRFGFVLGRSSQNLWKRWPPHPLAVEYYLNYGFEALHAMTPAIAMPIYSAYRHLISHDLGFAGLTLNDGWFRADKLPLEKYVSPFLFRNDQMSLAGTGEFSGRFDEQKIVVNYDAQDMVLQNSDFSIEIESLSGKSALAANKLVATYMFDLNTKTSLNTFPIRNATYFEKNSGLLYTDVNADFSVEDTRASFEGLNAFCNGLYFAGTADIDWSMPGEGVFEVDVHAHEMHGKVSQLQHLLSHLNKSMVFLKIPIEGTVGLHNDGGRLHFSFYKGGYDVESVIEGMMSDGAMSEENADLSLQELSVNFDYNHKENTLSFTDWQGALLVGRPGHVEEYSVSGDGVRFTDYSRDEAVFDIWVGDRTRDIIRLSGKTRLDVNEQGVPFVNFLFNKSLSHFGDVHPAKFKFGLKDWSQLELLEVALDFQLKTLLADLQRFSRTGFLFLSRGLLKELNDIDVAKGEIQAAISYDSARSTLNYHVDGEDVALGRREFGKFLLSGSKKGSLWSVDQMKLDDMHLAFDVVKEGPLWNINFLGARLGNYLLLGMEGQYSDEDSHLEARINLFEADLARLGEWPLLNPSFDPNMIGGQIRATGMFHADLDKAMPQGMHLKLSMNGSLNNAKIRDVHLEDIKDMSFHYDTARGLSLKNVNLGIRSGNSIKAALHVKEANYDTGISELLIDGLHFDIPAENLPWAVQRLQENFPDKFSNDVADAIRSSKSYGSLQGTLRLTSSDPYSSLRLHLKDGVYNYMGNEHDLSSFVIDYDPFAFKVFTEYRYRKNRFRLDAHSAANDSFDSGEIIVSEISDDSFNQKPLSVLWRTHPQAGFQIQKMAGELAGMTFDLVRDPNQHLTADAMNLIGRVGVDCRRAVSMLDDELAGKVACMELGEGYALNGQWTILKGNSKPLADSLYFKGDLTGRDFEFYGYRFYDLSSHFQYSPEAAFMRNLAVSDTCGNVQIEQMDFLHQGNGYWQALSPGILVNEFRPSLLKPVKPAPAKAGKALVIRNLVINDLNGILGDRNSFTGFGQLTFANPPKKNLQPTILAIPAELLTRIGLDLAVLTPVRGTILFNIKDGKADLNRFKDVYSKGRLSKFLLANNGQNSYVDFDGNLNLQVRMKQYNIIFKLAELFTVTVQGTLRKPTYALQKQQKSEETSNTAQRAVSN